MDYRPLRGGDAGGGCCTVQCIVNTKLFVSALLGGVSTSRPKSASSSGPILLGSCWWLTREHPSICAVRCFFHVTPDSFLWESTTFHQVPVPACGPPLEAWRKEGRRREENNKAAVPTRTRGCATGPRQHITTNFPLRVFGFWIHQVIAGVGVAVEMQVYK
jgi:hypothetical protein